MKDLLAKLLGMFHKPDPQQPVEPWPFPVVKEEPKAPAKKRVAAKGVVAAAKKTAAKKTANKKAK